MNIAKVDEKKQAEGYIALIDEVLNYPKFKYEFGKIVYFKTKKVEAFKKRESSKIEVDSNGKEEKKITRQYVVNYITPDFVICGY